MHRYACYVYANVSQQWSNKQYAAHIFTQEFHSHVCRQQPVLPVAKTGILAPLLLAGEGHLQSTQESKPLLFTEIQLYDNRFF